MLRWKIVVGLVAACAAALPASAATPTTLYHALLMTRFAPTELPSGFRLPNLTRAKPSPTAVAHHVVGEVKVTTNGPDADDEIFYEVFPTATEARADLPRRLPAPYRVLGTVAGYQHSALIIGSRKGGYGITAAVVQEHNVIVTSTNDWTQSSKHGNLPAALALLRSPVRHLARVRAR